MQKRNFHSGSRSNSGSRPHSNFKKRPAGGRGAELRPLPYRGPRPGNGRRAGKYIDPALFVNKAKPAERDEVFTPKHRFEDFEISPEVKKAIASKGYITPTPIQDQAIPQVLKGKDVVGIANTGTGKTAAFLIPLIHAIRMKEKKQVLVLVPTRELAIQINTELRSLARTMHIFSACCVGGAPIGPQLAALRHTNQFVIGTPGRVKDLIERGAIRLGNFDTVVLDEADRMLDMGFVNDMRFVMNKMPKWRHTLFFSATMSPQIESLISEFLNEPVKVSVKTRDTSGSVDQDIVVIEPGAHKLDVLHGLLTKEGFSKVLVFGATKHGVEKLSKHLAERGIRAASIHGNKTHTHRQRALGMFKDNHVQVLVATDVAARGLDISDVSHVINYDLPMTYEDYVHRIGRTGRGEKKGTALTFIPHGEHMPAAKPQQHAKPPFRSDSPRRRFGSQRRGR